MLECLARYSVEKMPYLIPPKHYPSGHEKVGVRSRFPSISFILFVVALTLRPRGLCPQVVTPLVWNKPDIENSVPLWIIILAILAGLLLLALLIYVLYKVRKTQTVIISPLKPPAIRTCFFFLLLLFAVWILQAICTLRRGHGESTNQTRL